MNNYYLIFLKLTFSETQSVVNSLQLFNYCYFCISMIKKKVKKKIKKNTSLRSHAADGDNKICNKGSGAHQKVLGIGHTMLDNAHAKLR